MGVTPNPKSTAALILIRKMIFSERDLITLPGGLIIEPDKGKITGQRVLDVTNGPKVESSFTMDGKYKGLDATNTGTFRNVQRDDGIQYVKNEEVDTEGNLSSKVWEWK